MLKKFRGGVHDISLFDTGELRSVSSYWNLGLALLATEIRQNPNAKITMDCTGSLVQDVWLSEASEMAMRARTDGRAKSPKETNLEKREVRFDALNFYIFVSLPTGPLLPYEAVVIERTTSTFEDMLQKLKKKLSLLGKLSDAVRYVTFYMSLAFSNAVCYVFNNLRLPEYMATLMYALKTGNEGVRKRLIKTHIRWCDIHQNRAVEN